MNDAFILTKPGNLNPLLLPISYRDESGGLLPAKVDLAYTDLVQIAKWSFLRDLEHQPSFPDEPAAKSETGPGRFPIELKILQLIPEEQGQSTEREHDHRKGTVSIDMTHDAKTDGSFTEDTRKPLALVRMELVNHSQRELYCSLLYLSQEFGVSCPFFEEEEFALPPEERARSKKMRKGDHLRVSIPAYIVDGNWDGLREYVKLVVSEEPFGVETLKMEGLPEPNGKPRPSTRGAFDEEEPEEEELPSYWSTHTVELFTLNPFFTESTSHAK